MKYYRAEQVQKWVEMKNGKMNKNNRRCNKILLPKMFKLFLKIMGGDNDVGGNQYPFE